MTMRARIKYIKGESGGVYGALMFVCPGCAELDHNTGLHMLPVNTSLKSPSWSWDGNLELPTLSPSILTRGGVDLEQVCHSFLQAGVFDFLNDCTHSLAGQRVPMLDLPSWVQDS
jgi:hypothetical protein